MSNKKSHESNWDQLAQHYQHEIISPWLHALGSPLQQRLRALPDKKEKTLLDLGCGTAPLIQWMAKHFQRIIALDGSQEMLRKAQARVPKASHIHWTKRTLPHLPPHLPRADLTLAINSLITLGPRELRGTLKRVQRNLKPGGRFWCVLPSLESLREQYQAVYHHHLRQRGPQEARQRTDQEMEAFRIDFALGRYHTDEMWQNYFTRQEIEKHWRAAGLTLTGVRSITYPPEHSFYYGPQALSLPPMWDWLILARRGP